jgi:hypothetical protein
VPRKESDDAATSVWKDAARFGRHPRPYRSPQRSEADQVRLDTCPAGVATARGRRCCLAVLRSSLGYATRPDGVHGLRDPQRAVRLSRTGPRELPARGDKASCPSWIRPRCRYRHALGLMPHSPKGLDQFTRPDAGNGNRRPFPEPWPPLVTGHPRPASEGVCACRPELDKRPDAGGGIVAASTPSSLPWERYHARPLGTGFGRRCCFLVPRPRGFDGS